MTTIRLATFNMHHGKVDLVPYTHQAMVASVAELGADVVCLQETDVYSLRTRLAHQPRLVGRKLDYFWKSGFIRYFGIGFQHNAILSKFPIVSYENISLPSKQGQQKRKALIAEIDVEGKMIKVLCTHLHAIKGIENHNQHGIDQLRFVYEYARDKDIEIVAGDFNQLDDVVKEVSQEFGFIAPNGYPTSPAKNPRYQIDWISSRKFGLENLEVSSMLTSDHRALSADVVISE